MNEHMKKSMLYERVYAELINFKILLGSKENEELKSNNGVASDHYELVRKELNVLIDKYRSASDDEFAMCKAKTKDYDLDGLINLANAVLEQMALDYESALSKNDEGEKTAIEHFANNDARLYTTLDPMEILNRIAEDHKRFKHKAHECFDELFTTTAKLRADGIAFAERRNPYRCPLCHGGMYVKSKSKNNLYVVGCSGCSLTEIVKRERSKADASQP